MKKTPVAIAAFAAAGEGAAPIPFSDCALLVLTQLTIIGADGAISAGTAALKEDYRNYRTCF